MKNQSISLLRDRDVAHSLNISVSSVWRRVRDGTLPQPIRIGYLSRWSEADIGDAIDRAKYVRDSQ